MNKRIGIIGFGFIGRSLYEKFSNGRSDVDVDFVFRRNSKDGIANMDIPFVNSIPSLSNRYVDLVVEAAHPSVVFEHGMSIVKHTDFMPVSVNALADDDFLTQLTLCASDHNHKILVPRGALPACDDLISWSHMWRSVDIAMRKNPSSFDRAIIRKAKFASDGTAILYDGLVSGISERFPRNVNAIVAGALATLGPEKCRATLVADKSINFGEIVVRAEGRDGSILEAKKQQPMNGVSGTEMVSSVYRSVLKSLGLYETIDFV